MNNTNTKNFCIVEKKGEREGEGEVCSLPAYAYTYRGIVWNTNCKYKYKIQG
jgi:hypothetical protein